MASDYCPGATRKNPDPNHRFRHDMDNPWLTCDRCGEVRDAVTGRTLPATPEPPEEPDHVGRTRPEAWRDAAIQAKNDLRAIEEAFAEATPVGEDGPDPPIGPGYRFAQWTSPAVTMRWIERMEESEGNRVEAPKPEGGEAWEEIVAWLSVARGYLERGAEPTSEHYKAAQAQIGNAIHAIERRARLSRTPTASERGVIVKCITCGHREKLPREPVNMPMCGCGKVMVADAAQGEVEAPTARRVSREEVEDIADGIEEHYRTLDMESGAKDVAEYVIERLGIEIEGEEP